MPYYKSYGPQKETKKRDRGGLGRYICLFVLAATIITASLFPGAVAQVRKRLFPFFEPQIRTAFGHMVSQIEEGVSFTDAAAAFCQAVMYDDAG